MCISRARHSVTAKVFGLVALLIFVESCAMKFPQVSVLGDFFPEREGTRVASWTANLEDLSVTVFPIEYEGKTIFYSDSNLLVIAEGESIVRVRSEVSGFEVYLNRNWSPGLDEERSGRARQLELKFRSSFGRSFKEVSLPCGSPQETGWVEPPKVRITECRNEDGLEIVELVERDKLNQIVLFEVDLNLLTGNYKMKLGFERFLYLR